MKRCSVRTSVRLGPEARLTACLALWLATSSLPVLANQDGGGAPPLDSRLSATLMGRLEPGAQGRIAVRWNGPEGSLIDVWVDLDGDGDLGSHELVVGGRPLTLGIEVVSFELPAGEPIAAEPKVWVRARARGWCDGAAAIAAVAGGDGSGCAWQPGFEYWRLEGSVAAMIVWDDGTGPALYVGGSFAEIGPLTVNNVARWDGGAWSALSGPTGAGVEGWVETLAVFDDGNGPALFAGGEFDMAGGVTVNNIARWDGTAWSALSAPSGTGVNGEVYALAGFDDGTGPALYAGGRFETAGGVTVNHIARWDGSEWTDVGGGVVGSFAYVPVRALAIFDDGSGLALYAGGCFETAGGVTVNHIARWDGGTWSTLGSGIGGDDPRVYALTVFDDGSGPALYVGGHFDTAGSVTVNHVARWDGSAWSSLSGPSGTGVAGGYPSTWVGHIAVFDDGSGPALYVGGHFDTAGGVTVNHIARWDGSAWSSLSGPSGTGIAGSYPGPGVVDLAAFDDGSGPALYVGGHFDRAGGVAVNHIARWDGGNWSALASSLGAGVSGPVSALTVFDDGSSPALFAGGEFDTAGSVTVNHVARWDGSEWSALTGASGTGVDGGVYALAGFDDGSGPALYAGGWFETAGGVPVNNIARWDGAAWSALTAPSGTGVKGEVYALAGFDDASGPALYAGGWFESAGGVPVNNIARWDGSHWSDVGGGAIGSSPYRPPVRALAGFDDGRGPALYAGGRFDTAGGVTVNNIARWDGNVWSALVGPAGTGVDGGVEALAVCDDGSGPALYAGGWFFTAGGMSLGNIARWNGSEWSDVGGGIYGVWTEVVSALAVLDDGTGPALYAGGAFSFAGGTGVANIARWDGKAWSALGTGVGPPEGPPVRALSPFDDGSGPTLYVGGDFTTAGGLQSDHIAAWRCPAGLIFADDFESGSTTAWSAVVP